MYIHLLYYKEVFNNMLQVSNVQELYILQWVFLKFSHGHFL